MKSNKFKMNKKGVFGLTAIQQFFAVILGIALLAYIIVVIMGTLSGTNIIPLSASGLTNQEDIYINATGIQLSATGIQGFANPAIIAVYNSSNGSAYASGFYRITANGYLYNGSATQVHTADGNLTFTYSYYGTQQKQVADITGNTSTGITGFFASINPVYAILAVLVIILVLVVLVRVVQAPGRSSAPQL